MSRSSSATHRSSNHLFSRGAELFRQFISASLIWVMVMSSLPSYADESSESKWERTLAPSQEYVAALGQDSGQSQPALSQAESLSMAQGSAKPGRRKGASELLLKPGSISKSKVRNTESALLASTGQPLPVALAESAPGSQLLAGLESPLKGVLTTHSMVLQSQGQPQGIAGLAVFVGYADDLRANPNFPVPWQGSPNTTFIGAVGPGFDTGAIRLDNNTDSPISIDDVFVTVPGWTVSNTQDVHGNGTADLWGSFSIPPHASVILAQTSGNNFDTSDFGVTFCGNTLPNGQAPIPTVKITIGGVATTFSDTGHVLDTGGFDLACRGNESLQWRLIGTSGIENSAGHITLSPATSIQPAGTTYTATAQVTDAGNQPTPHVVVNFVVLSGPNAGKQGAATTDSQGNATFSYSSPLAGTDILRASVTNSLGGTIQSDQVTTTWLSADPCPAPVRPPDPSTTILTYAGQLNGEFNDPLTLAAQLTDGNGNPLTGRSVSFAFAGQTTPATTDGNGVATINVATAPTPGPAALSVSYAGETNFQPAQLSTSIAIGREETTLRYAGSTLLGTAVPQPVSAVLTDSQSGLPIANEPVIFQVGTVTAQAITNAAGIASTTLTLGPDQTSGPTAIRVSFAGDKLYKPSLAGVQITVYLSTSFVVWGGNTGGLQLGQDVNFWGHSWADQVTGGNFTANPSFKGFADPVQQVHVCEAGAGNGGPLDDRCWSSKPGNSFPPPLTVPAYIEVIVSTAIAKQGSEIFGNIAAAAVCKVDPAPAYGSDPGSPGFCKLVAVVEDGANIFPQPPAITATQKQPATVLPAQNFNVTTTINNSSGSIANSIAVNESFDGVAPLTGTQTFGSILTGAQQTATFQETTPSIPQRQSNESSVDYQARLGGIDGRIFTSTGSITFTDAIGQNFLPIPVNSSSRLQIPELALGVSGTSCVGPGSKIPYKVNISNLGAADAKNVVVSMKFPDGGTGTATLATLSAGASQSVTFNFVVPGILAKQPGETDQQYQSRLATFDGSSLTANAKVDWQDAIGNNYGEVEQKFISTTERVPIITVTPQGPASLLPGQKATVNFTVQNNGGGNASQVLLSITNPDGSVINTPVFPLQGGQATVVSSTFTVPLVPVKQSGETDAAYQARLAALDNSALNFPVKLAWHDVAANVYGPTSPSFQTVEVLPVISVTLAGAPSLIPGENNNYGLAITNIGHADAANFTLPVQLPDGSVVNPFPASAFPPGATAQISLPFSVPRTQPNGQITAAATLNWVDRGNNAYGTETPTVVSTITRPDPLPPGSTPPPPPNGGGGGGGTTPPPPGPTVVQGWIGQPAAGTVVQGQLPITVAPGITLKSGVLDFWPVIDPNNIQTLNTNTTGSGTVGVFDGTLLQNGSYIIRLTAVDNAGNPQTNLTLVTVNGDLKPGRITTSVIDLVVPAKGLPISIKRTYDSLNSGRSLDFGFGWSLDTAVDIEISPSHDVTLTLTGQRRTFNFTPQIPSPLFGFIATPAYTAEPGVFGRLEETGDNCGGAFFISQGIFFCPFSTQTYQATGFRYTNANGTKYTIGADGTLQSIQDINGNTITVTAKGISSSTGLNVPFQRDALGRITQITDPLGKVYQYAYDGTGNLASVTYPALTAPTTYTYDSTHRLTGGMDPNNNPLPTKVLDANGRLASETDALGNTTSYAYSTASINGVLTNTTTVTFPPDANGKIGTATSVFDSYGKLLSTTDPLGHVTTNTYDNRHNLISTTDPLKHTTTFTYDAQGNQTSVTYPKTATSINTTSATTYNQFSEPTSHTDELGNVQNVSYDTNFLPQIITDTVNNNPVVVQSFHYNTDGTKQSEAIGFDLTIFPNKVTTYSYDANGNLASSTDPLGRITSFIYDDLGLLRSVTRPLPAPIGQASTSNSTATNTTAYQYDDFGRLTEIDAPLGRVTKYTYDNNGNKISETDPNGNITTFKYDVLNRLKLTTFPTIPLTTESRTYDFRGKPINVTDRGGHVVHNEYDLAGRLISVTIAFGTPDASTVSYAYDDDGRWKTQTDSLGSATAYVYDEAGRLTGTTDALGHQTISTYDDAGRLIANTDPNQQTTKYSYDSRGRQQQVAYPDSTTTLTAYDSANNVIAVTDQAERQIQYSYDDANQLVSVMQVNHPDPAHNTTIYTYDNLGDLATWNDANGHQNRQAFDIFGELIAQTYPAGGPSETNSYDPAGNLASVTDFKGKTTTYSYDALNRLIRETPDPSLTDPPVTFTYTATGQVATMTDNGGTIIYTYDNQDRVKAKTTPAGTLIYTYDVAANVSSMVSSNPNGASISYTYDQLNRLSTVTDNRLPAGQGTSVYTYDPASNLVTVTLPNGVQSTLSYDNLNRLKSVQSSTGNSSAIASFAYQLDPTGNRTAASELTGRSVQWSYDGIRRLTSETISQDPNGKNGTVSYGLDPVGNRLSVTSNLFNISSGVFSFNANDFLSTEGYDNNGNVTAEAGNLLGYDFQGRLVIAKNPANNIQVQIAYDAFGNRISKTVAGVTTQYLVDEQNPTGLPQVVEEVANGTVQKTYTYGYILLSQNQFTGSVTTPRFYGYDGGGNVRFLTDAAGQITDTYDYDAFGNLINAAGGTINNYLYRGRQFDADLGLYYLRARYYNPATGRFLSRDPEPGDFADPATFHRYLYADSDPVDRIDPTGRFSPYPTGDPLPPPTVDKPNKPNRGGGSEYALLVTAVALAIIGSVARVGYELRCIFRKTGSAVAAAGQEIIEVNPCDVISEPQTTSPPLPRTGPSPGPNFPHTGPFPGPNNGGGSPPPSPPPPPPPDDPCKDLAQKIQQLRDELDLRQKEFIYDKLKLPLFTPPGSGLRSRTGEAQQFFEKQQALNKTLSKFNDKGCSDPIPADAWWWANKQFLQGVPEW